MSSINTPSLLQAYLESLGYATVVSRNSVVIQIGNAANRHSAAFTFLADQLSITCQLAVLGDFAPEKLQHLTLAALDMNMEICPYAFAIIASSEGDASLEECPLVLTDTLLTSDLHVEEVAYALEKLLEAVAASQDILKLASN